MKQSTAIRIAFNIQGFYDKFSRNGEYWHGKIYGMPWCKIAHVDDVRTVDHNGHSTRVYVRDHLVATVHGVVDNN